MSSDKHFNKKAQYILCYLRMKHFTFFWMTYNSSGIKIMQYLFWSN